jgi:NADPH-dependent 2,4-dienoyl-CoA reductase/sulfur reductase-like enzyme
MKPLQLLLVLCLFGVYYNITASADPPSTPPRVAIVGGGIGGAAAAHFLRKDNPTWHIEL